MRCHGCLALTLDAEDLGRYGGALGLRAPEESLVALARAISSSPGWDAVPGAVLVARPRPRPLLAVFGRFDAGARAWLEAQARQLGAACRDLRYVGQRRVEAECRRLAARLEERCGAEQLRRASFVAIPRGGAAVLARLERLLELEPTQLESSSDPDRLLVVVDDCAVSGVAFARFLATSASRRLVFAHLYSHRELRSALVTAESRLLACVAAGELPVYDLAELPADWRDRWRSRTGSERYWIGCPKSLGFPWGEPERLIWNAVRQQCESAWRVVPPELCAKHRVAGSDAVPVQVQALGRGAVRAAPHLVCAELEGQVVIGDSDSGRCLGLGRTGSRIWRSILRHGRTEPVVGALVAEFELTETAARRHVRSFVAELTARGLLAAAST